MKTVAFLTSAEGIEQAELAEPWRAVRQAGHLISSRKPADLPAFCDALTRALGRPDRQP